jgi:parallel beta-helix repeat protein
MLRARIIAPLALLSALLTSSPAGELEPPGAPASTPGPEPRIAVSAETTPGTFSALFVISAPGSYYLTDNITGESGKSGIVIEASDVTLDLNGFNIGGVPGSPFGIYAFFTEVHGVTVRNGTVSGWHTSGVDLTAAVGSRVENVTARSNGFRGIQLGEGAEVLNCTSEQNSDEGIFVSTGSRVTNCTSRLNDDNGIVAGGSCFVLDCVVQSCGGPGIHVNNGSTVADCVSFGNQGTGIEAGTGCTVSGCTVRGNSGTGIAVNHDCRVADCTVTANGGGILGEFDCLISDCVSTANSLFGIRVTTDCHVLNSQCRITAGGQLLQGVGIDILGVSNRIEGNTVIANDVGIRAVQADNLIVRNVSRANTTSNFNIVPGNEVAEILSSPGEGFTSSNAWANFTF